MKEDRPFLIGIVVTVVIALGLLVYGAASAQKPRKIPQAEVQAYLEQELIKADDRAQKDHETIALKQEQIVSLQRQLDDLRLKCKKLKQNNATAVRLLMENLK